MTARPTVKLGRGMAALMGESASAELSLQNISVDALEPGPYQPRGPIEELSLLELAASIRTQGVLQPILVRRDPGGADRFQIIAGERRWRAAMLADRGTVPCHVRDVNDRQASEIGLIENLQRSDLNALEEAAGYRRLMDEFGLTQQNLAESVGRSRPHVANGLRLLGLPEAVQSHLRNGAITAGHARAILSHPDPVAAADQIIARGLSVRQAEALVERSQTEQSRAAPAAVKPTRDADLVAVETDLSERLGLRVVLQSRGDGGSLTLHYVNLDQLDHVLARLGR